MNNEEKIMMTIYKKILTFSKFYTDSLGSLLVEFLNKTENREFVYVQVKNSNFKPKVNTFGTTFDKVTTYPKIIVEKAYLLEEYNEKYESTTNLDYLIQTGHAIKIDEDEDENDIITTLKIDEPSQNIHLSFENNIPNIEEFIKYVVSYKLSNKNYSYEEIMEQYLIENDFSKTI